MARNKKKPSQVCTKIDFGYTEKPEVLTAPLPALDAVFTCSGIDEAAEQRAAEELGEYVPEGAELVDVEMTYADAIEAVCSDMKHTLLAKNRSYGGAAFKDVVLAGMHVSAEKAILVRMSDKIRRLQEGEEFGSEDTILDLVGYGILLQAVRLYKTERGE